MQGKAQCRADESSLFLPMRESHGHAKEMNRGDCHTGRRTFGPQIAPLRIRVSTRSAAGMPDGIPADARRNPSFACNRCGNAHELIAIFI